MKKIVDLHVHSYYSDGTYSPRKILDRAIEKKIDILAIADHEVLEGTKELLELSANSGVQCISGVELDAITSGVNFHILAYGFDTEHTEFNAFVKRNKELLELVNIKLVEKLARDYENISIEDYTKFEYDRTKGGWKALHYFMEKGITTTLLEGMGLFRKYEHSYTCVSFPSVQQVCDQIRKAGGQAILAHPGKVNRTNDMTEFKGWLNSVVELGIDGIECYYTTHSEEVTNICLQVCNEKELLITCGSDDHGDFLDIEMGELQVRLEQLNLGDLLSK